MTNVVMSLFNQNKEKELEEALAEFIQMAESEVSFFISSF
jgi:hypothetical protein